MAEKSLSPKRAAGVSNGGGGASYITESEAPPPLPSEPPPLEDPPSPTGGYGRSHIPVHNGNTTSKPKSGKSSNNGSNPKKSNGQTPKFPTSISYYNSPSTKGYGDRVASPPGYSSIGPVGSPPGSASGYAGIYNRPGSGSSLPHDVNLSPNSHINWGGSGTEHVYAVPMKGPHHKQNHNGPVPVPTPSLGYHTMPQQGVSSPRNGQGNTLAPPHYEPNGSSPSASPTQNYASPRLTIPQGSGKVPSSSTLSSSTSSSASLSSVIHNPDSPGSLSTSVPQTGARPPTGANPEKIERATRPKALGKVTETRSDEEMRSVGGNSVSTSSLGIPSSQPSTPKLERGAKQTLGDIIQQIEAKFKFLLRKTDFTGCDTIPELQYIAQQSRYSSDINIKKRLVGKLVENGLLDLFIRVFSSVHKTDYLGAGCDDTSREDHVANGSANGSTEVLRDDEEKDSSVAEDNSSLHEHRLDNKPATDAMRNLRYAVTCLLNCTDKSPQLCDQCAKRGLQQTLLRELDDPRLAASELKEPNRLFLVKSYLGVLNNIIRYHDKSRESFREAGAVRLLQPYLKSSLLLVKTKAIMLMSYVVNETENDLVYSGTDRSIGFLLKMLQSALDASNHYSKKYGHWAVEIAAAVNRLAACENNKPIVVEKVGLPLYACLIDRGCTEEEQLVAARGLWTLAFNEANRPAICSESACMAGLDLLGRESQREEIRRAARGALWVVRSQLPVPRPAYTSKHRGLDGPVVISFQWSSRNVVSKLKERLRNAGYNVVTYTDSSGGAPVEKMKESLERASVVLVAMSHKFHDSPACRTELEVACRLRCELISLKVQARYSPEGWLAKLMDSKLSFDFTHEANMESMTSNLMRELGSRGRCKGAEHDTHVPRGGPSTSSLHTVAAQVHAPPTSLANGPISIQRDATFTKWSPEDVSHWLCDNNLSYVTERFRQIDGDLLVELKKMQTVAPETFYTTLRHEMRFDLVTTLRFTKALSGL